MNTLQQLQWIGMLLARISVGLLFAISGAGKLFVRARREQMRQTLVAARIPVPGISAIFVSLVEFVFGVSLVIGFLTPLCSLMLIAVMLGALSTTILPGIKAKSAVSWLGEFLYLPEVLYVVILVWLFFPDRDGSGWITCYRRQAGEPDRSPCRTHDPCTVTSWRLLEMVCNQEIGNGEQNASGADMITRVITVIDVSK